jgi:Mg/Co/Ni transporter MgtE
MSQDDIDDLVNEEADEDAANAGGNPEKARQEAEIASRLKAMDAKLVRL